MRISWSVFILVTVINTQLFAQPINKGLRQDENVFKTQGDGGEPPPPPTRVPISGIEWLIGGAMIYGASKFLKKEKNEKTQS